MFNISLQDVLSSLAIALDFAEISSIENADIIEDVTNINYSEHRFIYHSRRTTYIALKMAECLNLDSNLIKTIYVSSILHDIGASNVLSKSHTSSTFIKEHCILGAEIVEHFPVFDDINKIILYHHENWDGSGPFGLKGNEIPIESQIIRLADLVDLIYEKEISPYHQKEKIKDWIVQNKEILFSKKMIDTFLNISSKDVFWFDIGNIPYIDFILYNLTPDLNIYLNLHQFEDVAYVFSKIIDTKSNFTAKHSNNIAELAYKISKFIGYSEEKCLKLKIAGLLHDVGKLSIPTEILDKNSKLTDEEFAIIKSHVYYTDIILSRITNIDDIRYWASNHHEKLNGEGYPKGLTAKDLSEECRIIAVCDIFQALTEERPYRKGLSITKAFNIMQQMVDNNFICGKIFEYLKKAIYNNYINL